MEGALGQEGTRERERGKKKIDGKLLCRVVVEVGGIAVAKGTEAEPVCARWIPDFCCANTEEPIQVEDHGQVCAGRRAWSRRVWYYLLVHRHGERMRGEIRVQIHLQT